MQQRMQPEFPLLYSLAGFRYADLLLFPAECGVEEWGSTGALACRSRCPAGCLFSTATGAR